MYQNMENSPGWNPKNINVVCCRFAYTASGFLRKKTYLIKDEEGHCQFCIHIYSLLEPQDSCNFARSKLFFSDPDSDMNLVG